MPAGYERTLDLFVVLTMAAAATTTIKLGTGICQIVQRDPIVTAKAVASVDHISGGRMVLVTGSSWNIEEMRNHGTDPATRYELLEERVLAMREIWRSDEATFHGEFVNFDRIWSWPKPIQDPMPVFVGGNSPGAEERAMRAGTGWSPLHLPGIPERMRAYTEKAAADGVTTSALGVGGPLSRADHGRLCERRRRVMAALHPDDAERRRVRARPGGVGAGPRAVHRRHLSTAPGTRRAPHARPRS